MGQADGITFRDRSYRTLYWKGVDDFVENAVKARRQAIVPWLSLRDWLVAAKHLTPEEASQLEPPLTVKILDERKDRSVPLPKLPPFAE